MLLSELLKYINRETNIYSFLLMHCEPSKAKRIDASVNDAPTCLHTYP